MIVAQLRGAKFVKETIDETRPLDPRFSPADIESEITAITAMREIAHHLGCITSAHYNIMAVCDGEKFRSLWRKHPTGRYHAKLLREHDGGWH